MSDPTQKITPECSFTVPHLNHRSYRITSLSYSPDGRDMLANYSNEEVYLFSLNKDPNITAVANDFLENAPTPPPYRRIRLRGDWADTGPLSRPSGMNFFFYKIKRDLVILNNTIDIYEE